MTIEQLKAKHGEELDTTMLNTIKARYRLSSHAIEQLRKRSLYLSENNGFINFAETKANINKAIDSNILAYYNTDGSVNIAIDKFHYFVFAYKEAFSSWTLVTYKETSWYGIDIYQKRQMAIDGFDRQYK